MPQMTRAKTGGRVKGTPNKKTEAVMERLAELQCDPIEGMALIAMNADNPPELRGRMYAELAQYVAPKRKAIEQTTDITINYVARIPEPATQAIEWQNQHAPKMIQ